MKNCCSNSDFLKKYSKVLKSTQKLLKNYSKKYSKVLKNDLNKNIYYNYIP